MIQHLSDKAVRQLQNAGRLLTSRGWNEFCVKKICEIQVAYKLENSLKRKCWYTFEMQESFWIAGAGEHFIHLKQIKWLASWGTTNPRALNAGEECVSFFDVIQKPKIGRDVKNLSSVCHLVHLTFSLQIQIWYSSKYRILYVVKPESLEWFHLFSTGRVHAWRWKTGRAAGMTGTCGKASRVQNAWSI